MLVDIAAIRSHRTIRSLADGLSLLQLSHWPSAVESLRLPKTSWVKISQIRTLSVAVFCDHVAPTL